MRKGEQVDAVTVSFADEDGSFIPCEQVRAGMTIVSTEYVHDARSLVCTVRRGS